MGLLHVARQVPQSADGDIALRDRTAGAAVRPTRVFGPKARRAAQKLRRTCLLKKVPLGRCTVGAKPGGPVGKRFSHRRFPV